MSWKTKRCNVTGGAVLTYFESGAEHQIPVPFDSLFTYEREDVFDDQTADWPLVAQGE